MNQSFYRKEGLDYLYFQRPGTAYERDLNQSVMMGSSTRSNFFDPTGSEKKLKPLELVQKSKPNIVT